MKKLRPRPDPKRAGKKYKTPKQLKDSETELPTKIHGGTARSGDPERTQISVTLDTNVWKEFQRIRKRTGWSTPVLINELLRPITKKFKHQNKVSTTNDIRFWYSLSLFPGDHPHLRSTRQ